MARLAYTILLIHLAAGSLAAEEAAPGGTSDEAAIEFFEKQVRPILATHCYECHGPETQEAELRLDSLAAILKGGTRGPAVIPREPGASNLVVAIGYGDAELQMPPSGKLPDEAIARLTEWVQMGAIGPIESPAADAPLSAEFDLSARKAAHWAWQPLRDTPPPEVRDREWNGTTIDRHIFARLEAAGLSPAQPAEKRTLIRRASFDLIGLPPTAEEIDAFLADESDEAFARLIDRLLDSPHFGERWGRHWLDLARYAETKGHEFDAPIPNAFQYRDYVIRAFNADVPYDRFVVEQIAGDLVDPPRLDPRSGANESVLGTGFWFLGEEVHSPVDIRGDGCERMDNKLDVFGKTFLGLTIACARCHDHKFDAISTKDYYALSGFLLGASYRQVPFETIEQNRRIAAELKSLRDEWRPKLLESAADGLRQGWRHTADYLVAARDCVRAESSDPASGQGAIESAARMQGLESARLAAIVAHLSGPALASPADPLHVWAVLAADPTTDAPDRLAAIVAQIVDESRAARLAADRPSSDARTIIDYCRAQPEDWLPDGPGFGESPAQSGDLRVRADPSRPIERVFHRAAAQFDPLWNNLKPSPETEKDTSKIAWPQAGRTLRTPTFTLSAAKKLYYLVRGSGHVFASVDQHRLIAGPLHTGVVRDFAGGDSPQWVEHDLSAYAGHRVHLEFTPKSSEEVQPGESAELAIERVVEATAAPPTIDGLLPSIVEILTGPDAATTESLAAAFETALFRAVDRLADDSTLRGSTGSDAAAIADWMLTHGDLAARDDGTVDRAALAHFFDRQAQLVAQIARASATAPSLLDGSGVDEFVLHRGNHRTPGEAVPRRFLEAIGGPEQPAFETGSGRAELARRLVDPTNPLVARVYVNRVWQHLFGRGLVASVDNFGVMGERPTHPELLDFLSLEFMADGWSTKRLIRRLMLTRTYRMSSSESGLAAERDPQNLLLSHMPVRRLEGEVVRDAILAISGRLDRRQFGPSVEVHLSDFMEGRGRPDASGPLDGDGRRSVYLRVRRNFLPSMFLAFDFPTPFTTIGRRTVSNVPSQALALLNGPFVVEQSRLWADRLTSDPGTSAAKRIDHMYVAAFARPAEPAEREAALAFLAEQSARYGAGEGDARAWADLCHVLFNVKEFIYLP